MQENRLSFPIFNAFIGGIFGAAIGYYISRIGAGILIGILAGFLIALLLELLIGRIKTDHWFYKRRVLFLVLLEIPLAIFILGPLAYVIVETRPNQHAICCETPLDFGAVEYKDVQIALDDGVILSGWYVPSQDPSDPVIVLLHGARGDRRGTAWHAQQLLQAGYGILMYDQRGLGESSGDRVYLGWKESNDLLSVLGFLEKELGVDPDKVGIVGLSGGGQIALNATNIDPNLVPALWLDGVTAQDMDDFPEAQNSGERFSILINYMIYRMAELYLQHTAPPPFSDILTTIEEPDFVLVAGGMEKFEHRVNQIYAEVISENGQVWFIKDAWHLGGPVLIPDEYSQRMVGFFDNAFQK